MILTRGGRLIRSSGKPRPVSGADSGPRFPEGLDRENTSQSECLFRDAASARDLSRKARPVLAFRSGMQFPQEPPSGNCIPEFA